MKYIDIQNWVYCHDLHSEVGQQKKSSKREADPGVLIDGMAVALWLLALIALWP